MFLIRLIRWLFGWIRFEAEGGFPERLLNLAARDEISLWGVKRKGIRMIVCCPVREYRRLRSPAHRAGMRMHVIERHGLPFILHRYRARAGVGAGFVVFIFVLQVLSQRIWVVKVRGNKKLDADKILSVMEQYGVREGADLKKLDIPNLQLEALRNLPDLGWCTVNLNGSVAYIDVSERIPSPELPKTSPPSNIKATCDGRIVSVTAYSGQAVVHKGDAVAKGMLLVSGVIESKIGPILQRSQARVLAETTRQFESSVPLRETCMLPSGRVINRPYLHFFSLNIPLYTDGPIDEENIATTSRHPLTANGINLPVGFINRRYELLQQTEIVRTEEEAAQLAKQQIDEDVKNELSAAQILSSNDDETVRDGCYVLKSEYLCIMDIGVEEPLNLENII